MIARFRKRRTLIWPPSALTCSAESPARPFTADRSSHNFLAALALRSCGNSVLRILGASFPELIRFMAPSRQLRYRSPTKGDSGLPEGSLGMNGNPHNKPGYDTTRKRATRVREEGEASRSRALRLSL